MLSFFLLSSSPFSISLPLFLSFYFKPFAMLKWYMTRLPSTQTLKQKLQNFSLESQFLLWLFLKSSLKNSRICLSLCFVVKMALIETFITYSCKAYNSSFHNSSFLSSVFGFCFSEIEVNNYVYVDAFCLVPATCLRSILLYFSRTSKIEISIMIEMSTK